LLWDFRIFGWCFGKLKHKTEKTLSTILTTYCFKKLAILSLREVAVLLRNRVNQIGIGNKETRKNNKQYNMRAIRAADLARSLEHARMHEALRN
jgi:hypothetical protein